MPLYLGTTNIHFFALVDLLNINLTYFTNANSTIYFGDTRTTTERNY